MWEQFVGNILAAEGFWYTFKKRKDSSAMIWIYYLDTGVQIGLLL